MITQAETSQDQVLSVSARDVQYLFGLSAVFSAILAATVNTAPAAYANYNLENLLRLYIEHYSSTEAHALQARLRTLLPIDSVIEPIALQPRAPLSS